MLAWLCLWLGSLAQIHAQTLVVSPSVALDDQPPSIRAMGLAPGERIMLRAELTDGAGQGWAAQAEFVADAGGVVDTAVQAPTAGDYQGPSAAGLIWSMRPTTKAASLYEPPHDLGPQRVCFSLLALGERVAQSEWVQVAMEEGVRQVRLTGALHGVLLLPASPGPHPAVLVLGGSEGGTPLRRAAWLASHGYVSLALAYFHAEDLPSTLESIPLEYFGRALTYLLGRPEVAPGQLAVVGTSRGAELALQLGSMYPQIRTVIAYAPADVRFSGCCRRLSDPAWTWGGQPLAYVVPGPGMSHASQPRAEIRVEQTHGAILLISGSDDAVWPAQTMADSLMRRLRQQHFAYPVEHLTYAHAGHRAGTPAIVPCWTGELHRPSDGRGYRFGGTPQGNAASTLDAGPKVLSFLRENLETGQK